jgi:hypothetical protein
MKILFLLSFIYFMACTQEQAKENTNKNHDNNPHLLVQPGSAISPPRTALKIFLSVLVARAL